MHNNHKIGYLKLDGFTIMELAVAMGIFAMIVYLVLTATVSSRASSSIAQAIIFINSQARLAVANITRDLMEAKASSVWMDLTGTDPETGKTVFRRVRFKVPLVDANGNLMTTAGGDIAFGANQSEVNFLRYALNGGDLERQIVDASGNPTGTTRRIAQNVQDASGSPGFSIRFHDDLTVPYEIKLSFSINSYGGIPLKEPVTFKTTIVVDPRN